MNHTDGDSCHYLQLTMPPKKRYDDEEKQFQKAFGVEKMREDFNLRAAIYLKDNIHEHINDKTKADKALEKINKLIQSSAVRTVHCGLANPARLGHCLVILPGQPRIDCRGQWRHSVADAQ